MQDYHDFIDKKLVDSETLQKRVLALGEEISSDYQGEDLHLIASYAGASCSLAT